MVFGLETPSGGEAIASLLFKTSNGRFVAKGQGRKFRCNRISVPPYLSSPRCHGLFHPPSFVSPRDKQLLSFGPFHAPHMLRL